MVQPYFRPKLQQAVEIVLEKSSVLPLQAGVERKYAPKPRMQNGYTFSVHTIACPPEVTSGFVSALESVNTVISGLTLKRTGMRCPKPRLM
jgi:hypothetical protein